MFYFVWPEDELRTVPGNPRHDAAVHKQLIDSRHSELQQLRDDILAAIAHRLPDVAAARASIVILAGIGQLLFDDAVVKMAWLDEYQRRKLRKVPDAPLPRMRKSMVRKSFYRRPAQPWHLQLINKRRGLHAAGVTIGVIDTGCDPTLPDLSAPGFVSAFGLYTTVPQPHMRPGLTPRDLGGHGSSVCAFLAGSKSGVAPGASLIVAAIPATLVIANQAMVQVALDWLNRIGCDIITTSVFTGAAGQVPQAGMVAGPSLESVEHALGQTRRHLHTLVTAAIGNAGNNGSFQHPGSSRHVMGVGAVNKAGKWFGSAFGDIGGGVHKPDIVAPGYALQLPTSANGYSILSGGTSFATPMVAGAAALLVAHDNALRGDPNGIQAKLQHHFVQAVRGVPPANAVGSGLLDLQTL